MSKGSFLGERLRTLDTPSRLYMYCTLREYQIELGPREYEEGPNIG